jgi:hypothetical protein
MPLLNRKGFAMPDGSQINGQLADRSPGAGQTDPSMTAWEKADAIDREMCWVKIALDMVFSTIEDIETLPSIISADSVAKELTHYTDRLRFLAGNLHDRLKIVDEASAALFEPLRELRSIPSITQA